MKGLTHLTLQKSPLKTKKTPKDLLCFLLKIFKSVKIVKVYFFLGTYHPVRI